MAKTRATAARLATIQASIPVVEVAGVAGAAATAVVSANTGAVPSASGVRLLVVRAYTAPVLPATGILWQSRGASFSLDRDATNPLAPGRKPFHRLNPALASFDDGRVLPYGATGGDGQPQVQAQILSRYRAGQSLAAAVAAPRWLLGRAKDTGAIGLEVEDRFDPSLLERLDAAGHAVTESGRASCERFGHAGMLVKHAKGQVEAVHDPRSDGDSRGI